MPYKPEKTRYYKRCFVIKDSNVAIKVKNNGNRDDVLVHDMWKSRFSEHSSEVSVKYFTQDLGTVDFITSPKEKNKAFLLSDYELENQELNGTDVIEKSNVQEQHILAHWSADIRNKRFWRKK